MAEWSFTSSYASVPSNAFVGGYDCDGSPIYVGRTHFNGDHLPVKVVPSKHNAYVAWGGEEHTVSEYEVLIGHCYNWVHCHGGSIPHNAVSSGHKDTGEPLYVGRAHYGGSHCVGKIHGSHGCIYIPFDGKEIKIEHDFEILTHGH